MHASLPYESIACLMFTHLPLPVGLSGPTARSATRLTLCVVDDSLGLHSLHLISFLG